jgi:hypothetical protein
MFVRTKRRGAAAIEFAIWLTVLLMFVSAVVDWGIYMTTRVTVARAVMEGTRTGASIFEAPNSGPRGSRIVPRTIRRTEQIFTDMGIPCSSPGCFRVEYCDTGEGGPCRNPPLNAIVIEARLDYTPFFGFVPTPDRIVERFEMAVESQP